MLKKLILALTIIVFASSVFADAGTLNMEAGPALETGVRGAQTASRIPALLEQSRTRIEGLEAQYASTGSEDLQLQIQNIKAETELQRLQLLADECRDHGRIEEAELAEAQLTHLQNPEQRTASSARQLTLEEKQERGDLRTNARPQQKKALTPSTTTEGSN